MSITIYTVSGAPRGWRVLTGLTIKQLDFTVKYLEVSKNELKSDAFLQVNPRATVPVLQYGDVTLRDSFAILAWLDRQFPARPLFGRDSESAAQIWQLATECSDYLRAATHELLSPVFSNKYNIESNNAQDQALINAAETAHQECRFLEKQLAQTLFLTSDLASAADAIVYPAIKLIERAINQHAQIMDKLRFTQLVNPYPRLAEWLNRMSELPGMKQTQPIHW